MDDNSGLINWNKICDNLVTSKTPLRISFAGGGTDLYDYWSKKGGLVVSAAINKYLYVSIKKHAEIFEESYRLNYSQIELANQISDINNIIVRGCLEYLQHHGKLFVATISDLVSGSGLGSSSSFCVGLLNCLSHACGEKKSSGELAYLSNEIEINHLKRPMGKQDAFPAAYGGLNKIKFEKDGSVLVSRIGISNKNLHLLNKSLCIVFTGKLRESNTILKKQQQLTQSNQNSNSLDLIKSHAEEMIEMLEHNFSLKSMGNYLNKTWYEKLKISDNISNYALDNLHTKILKSGALGAKLSGAGGGGFFLTIVEDEYYETFREKMSSNYVEKIQITGEGSSII